MLVRNCLFFYVILRFHWTACALHQIMRSSTQIQVRSFRGITWMCFTNVKPDIIIWKQWAWTPPPQDRNQYQVLCWAMTSALEYWFRHSWDGEFFQADEEDLEARTLKASRPGFGNVVELGLKWVLRALHNRNACLFDQCTTIVEVLVCLCEGLNYNCVPDKPFLLRVLPAHKCWVCNQAMLVAFCLCSRNHYEKFWNLNVFRMLFESSPPLVFIALGNLMPLSEI